MFFTVNILFLKKLGRILIQKLKSEEAKNILDNNKNVRLIDVREEWENHAAKIQNSELLPLSRFIEASKGLNKDDRLLI